MSASLDKQRLLAEFQEFKAQLHPSDVAGKKQDDPVAGPAISVGAQRDSSKGAVQLRDRQSTQLWSDAPHAPEHKEPPAGKGFFYGAFAAIEGGLLGVPQSDAEPAWLDAVSPNAIRLSKDDPKQWLQEFDVVASRDVGAGEQDFRSRRSPLLVAAALIIIVGIAGLGAGLGWRSESSSPETAASVVNKELALPQSNGTADAYGTIAPGAPNPDSSQAALVIGAEQPVDGSQSSKENSPIVPRADNGIGSEAQRAAKTPALARPLEPEQVRNASTQTDAGALSRSDAPTQAKKKPAAESRPPSSATASTPKKAATRVLTAPKPAADAKASDRTRPAQAARTGKDRAPESAAAVDPQSAIDPQVGTPLPQPAPPTLANGALSFARRAAASVTGVIEDLGRFATGSH